MPTIANPTLTVDCVDDRPGQRRVRVVYDVACDATDPAVGSTVVARIAVHAVNERDAAVPPRQTPILDDEESFIATAGTHRRSFDRIVHRVDLDVEQDWWSTSQGGEPDAIAEWLDHLVADIRLHVAGRLAAEATTPTVTGSWGALGQD